MITTLMVFQAVVSVLLIVVVLLQFGKGAEAGLFSGGGGEVFTGSQQGNILSKATVVFSILFLGNSILLAKLQGSKTKTSILDNETEVARPLNTDGAAGFDTKAAAPGDEVPPASPVKEAAPAKSETPSQ